MNNISRIATMGAVISLMSLSACVWERGRGGGDGAQRDGGRGDVTQHDSRDRNGETLRPTWTRWR